MGSCHRGGTFKFFQRGVTIPKRLGIVNMDFLDKRL
jgi:hypothetical protein